MIKRQCVKTSWTSYSEYLEYGVRDVFGILFSKIICRCDRSILEIVSRTNVKSEITMSVLSVRKKMSENYFSVISTVQVRTPIQLLRSRGTIGHVGAHHEFDTWFGVLQTKRPNRP